MTDPRLRDRVTALAALFQAARLVDEIANGEVPPARDGLAHGREFLGATLRREAGDRAAGARIGYAMAMMHLNGVLRGRPAMQEIIRTRLAQVAADSPGLADRNTDDVVAKVAALYVDTFGTLNFRVQVKGDPRQLQDAAVAARIRACLFAGVRAAHLWHHLGGRRWHLLFGARRMLEAL